MRRILFVLSAFLQVLGANATVDESNLGCLTALSIGAKGDGIHDDTKSIQAALDSLDSNGGGAIYLGSGTYMVSSIRLGKKTSMIGCGNGATVIRQMKDTKEDCVIIPAKSAALRVSNLSIVGNNSNCGLNIESSLGGTENHPYLYTKSITDNVPQPYKWITIDDVCIFHFGTGLNIEPAGFNINICNSTFSHNVVGVVMRCTDSSMYNCYITNNKKDGLHMSGSNNKISNLKSIFNGRAEPVATAAIVIHGSRNQIVNSETQDNYCKGFFVDGQYNLLSNCVSNTDGYAKEPKGYVPSVKACGFMIRGLYNSFSNCAVTSYTEKYGAVFHSPVSVDSAVAYYYPDIFKDIKVLIAKDKTLFHEPFRNVQTLASKNKMSSDGVIKKIDCRLNSLNVLLDFKASEAGNVIGISGDNQMAVSIGNKSVRLTWQGVEKARLVLDEDALLDKDDMRLIVSFCQEGQNLSVSMLMYEKTVSRGWIKKELRQDTDIPTAQIKSADLKIGDRAVGVKRVALSNIPMPESVFLPYSNTNRIYAPSFVYVDTDAPI